MKLVETKFICHPQVNKKRAGETRRQTNKVNEKRTLMPLKVSESDEKVVFEHKLAMMTNVTNKVP
jgi:hypothetical protein